MNADPITDASIGASNPLERDKLTNGHLGSRFMISVILQSNEHQSYTQAIKRDTPYYAEYMSTARYSGIIGENAKADGAFFTILDCLGK